MLSPDIIKAYNAVRKTRNKSLLCHAPFTNLNFEQNGNVTACCFNRKEILGRYPENSIAEIWNGKPLQSLREKIKSNDLDGGCKLCRILLESGNYSGTKAIYYDEYAHEQSIIDRLTSALGGTFDFYPKVFEFEISNVCNLECEMCSGYYSSAIRKNREKLPPLPQPYDDAFVEQVAAFMPRLTDLKFLGGEPFLIDIYYKIWDKVAAINPQLRIHITTNGTVFNNRVQNLLSRLKAGFVISIDSVNPQHYEKIRAGARFERVMDNFQKFREIALKKNTYLTIAACVMSNNWQDIPDIVRFANTQNVAVHFNMVWNPGHLSIRFLSYEEIDRIIAYLKGQHLHATTPVGKNNLNNFQEVIHTLEYWKKERSYTRLTDIAGNYQLHPEYLSTLPDAPSSRKLAALLLLHFLQGKNEPVAIESLRAFLGEELPCPTDIRIVLFDYWRQKGDHDFTVMLLDLYPPLYATLMGSDGLDEFTERVRELKSLLIDFKQLQAVVSDTIDDIARYGILRQLNMVKNNEVATLQKHLEESY
ncbi:MAG: hypothetical protein KatS3mg031_0865 [Chitinophagales bacterium]|nr:MAG: hypothetical protein KatS3mg031_0865 [Chitinophagales bacterium]